MIMAQEVARDLAPPARCTGVLPVRVGLPGIASHGRTSHYINTHV